MSIWGRGFEKVKRDEGWVGRQGERGRDEMKYG